MWITQINKIDGRTHSLEASFYQQLLPLKLRIDDFTFYFKVSGGGSINWQYINIALAFVFSVVVIKRRASH
jgi:hypothetical protein